MKNCSITDNGDVDLGTISSYPGLALMNYQYHERYVETEEWQTSGNKKWREQPQYCYSKRKQN